MMMMMLLGARGPMVWQEGKKRSGLGGVALGQRSECWSCWTCRWCVCVWARGFRGKQRQGTREPFGAIFSKISGGRRLETGGKHNGFCLLFVFLSFLSLIAVCVVWSGTLFYSGLYTSACFFGSMISPSVRSFPRTAPLRPPISYYPTTVQPVAGFHGSLHALPPPYCYYCLKKRH